MGVKFPVYIFCGSFGSFGNGLLVRRESKVRGLQLADRPRVGST